ncbi:MAG: methylisocitrate lyase [Conexivisphaera sp.]
MLGSEFTVAPGVWDPFSALLAERAGFRALYLSGAALTSSMGLPDLGLITLDEVAEAVRRIRRVTDLPIIVDADTGFGEALNVYRAVRILEEAGASAVQIEDQRMPKRCGHLEGKEVVSREEMVEKLTAALRARRRALIVARTDARGVMGLEEAIERGNLYGRAGADVIFPEALLSREEFEEAARRIKYPLLANMTEFGKSPYISAGEFREMGYRIVIFPVTAFRAAARAAMEAYAHLAERGTQGDILGRLMSREEQYEVIRYHSYEELDREIAREAARRSAL